MYLKKMIAHGFKSFADNTIIDFDGDISGIVGPNGSGKSNVVDAIRWVLGEQSIKSLRGDKTTDVIFAGSKSRRAMNAASVTLIFDNHDNYLPLSFDEVSIKRRLYKDGENEYFINGEKVRLKDVYNILMDSGIAKESFNIIQQGKIEEIISSKPENRRSIFEEAAGVTKYKKRKEDALKKLDKTHVNMDRVNDIIKELENRIEPLKKQSETALEYQDLKEQLKQLEISLIVLDITNTNDTYKEKKEKIDELKQDLSSISTNNSTNEAKSLEVKVKITNLDKKIKELQDKLLVVTEKVEQINSQKNIILERKKYQVDNFKLHNNIIDLKEQESKIKNEIKSTNREMELILKDYNNCNEKIKEENKRYDEIKKQKELLLDKLNKQVRLYKKNSNEIDILRDNIDNNSNYPYAVKKVLQNPKLRGIYDTVGGVCEVLEKYSKAISIALASNISSIIVENEVCASEAINYLKENKLGRVTFLPLNIMKEKYINKDMINLINIDGFIDIASNLVKYNKNYSNIVKNLLGNIIVVDNIDTANRLSKLINFNYRIVTLDGEIINVGGSLTGGNIKTRNIILDKYELERKIKEDKNYQKNIENIENDINETDTYIRNSEDKLYLYNKEKLVKNDSLNLKKDNIINLNKKLTNITNELIGTNNIIHDKLSNEEESIIDQYYNEINYKNEIVNKIKVLSENKKELENILSDFSYSIKKENTLYYEKNEQLKNLEIEINRCDVKLDNWLNTLNEEYNMTYEKAKSMYKLSIDVDEARDNVNTIKRKIKSLGMINLTSIEEYKKESERYEFLLKQQNDLINAKNILLKIIEDMDQIMIKEFVKTFDIINDNFQETFKELFKGGNAHLKLTNKDNILETGIDIIASPPGKTLKNISLLSGGEKTFTAISLLFAILKSRTLPFCVLDEVEAALDDVNVQSFGQYLIKLKEKTQFIVITHKKKTMEYANVLYGITMQESGVSKLVSVKLDSIEEKK